MIALAKMASDLLAAGVFHRIAARRRFSGIGAALFLALTSWLLPTPTRAGASLSKTTAWLTENLPGLAISDDGYASVTDDVTYSFVGCNMHVKERMSNIESTNPAPTRFYVISFRPIPGTSLYARPPVPHKFQPAAATTSPFNFGLDDNLVISLKKVDLSSMRIYSYTIDSSQPQTSAGSMMVFGSREVDIGTTDSVLAGRVLKALRHAATLCGAASSGF